MSLEGFSQTYNGRDYVVKDVSFGVKKGEIFGLLGKNGAGKTTTIKVLTTLLRPSKGKITVLGQDVTKYGHEIRKRIGVVQQEVSFEYTTVKENFDLYGFLWGVPKETREKRRNELVKMFGLQELLKTSAWDLSGGQKRRVQVAREFVHDMDLVFLDEPTVGLDPIMRRKILDLLKEKAKNEGLTILFTTHNLEEADYLCDRIAIMDRGKILALDTAENLKRIYGETKAIEISLSSGENSSSLPYDSFFSRLRIVHPDIEITKQPEGSNPAVIVSKEPEKVIGTVIALTSELRLKLEWLNIRKSTLEDVFIQTVSED
ncbi:MAG: ABC transporter ATP-binding protein, partial [Thaumarchaeota archaeon]|nr:ABC transporter ATP-binding protein [Nitrososphaerota archaeon]